MLYVTGIHALNLSCSLNTCGDWHTSALKWEKLDIRESENSIFKDWGIEPPKELPNGQTLPYANHLRAVLDILETGHDFKIRWLRGFRHDFLGTDEYNELLFSKVMLLENIEGWIYVDNLMTREFQKEWVGWRNIIRTLRNPKEGYY